MTSPLDADALAKRAVDYDTSDFLRHAAEYYEHLADEDIISPDKELRRRMQRNRVSMEDVQKLYGMETMAARKYEHVAYWYRKAHGQTTPEEDKTYAYVHNKFKQNDGDAKFPHSYKNLRYMGYIKGPLAEIFRYAMAGKRQWDNREHVLESEAVVRKRWRVRESASPSREPSREPTLAPPADAERPRPLPEAVGVALWPEPANKRPLESSPESPPPPKRPLMSPEKKRELLQYI